MKRKFCIVSDGSCDVPEEAAREYEAGVLPEKLQAGEENRSR